MTEFTGRRGSGGEGFPGQPSRVKIPLDFTRVLGLSRLGTLETCISLTPQPPLPKIRMTFDQMAIRFRSEFSGEGEQVFK